LPVTTNPQHGCSKAAVKSSFKGIIVCGNENFECAVCKYNLLNTSRHAATEKKYSTNSNAAMGENKTLLAL